MFPLVLICDDEPHVSRLAARKLDRAGFDVQTAVHADSAWQLLRRGSSEPALLILDYRMPGMDGLPFLERLREDERFAELPVIMLLPADAELGLDAIRLCELGVFATLRKPFSARRLVDLALSAIESPLVQV